MHLGLLLTVDFTDLTVGMLLLHAFTFDPGWVRPDRLVDNQAPGLIGRNRNSWSSQGLYAVRGVPMERNRLFEAIVVAGAALVGCDKPSAESPPPTAPVEQPAAEAAPAEPSVETPAAVRPAEDSQTMDDPQEKDDTETTDAAEKTDDPQKRDDAETTDDPDDTQKADERPAADPEPFPAIL